MISSASGSGPCGQLSGGTGFLTLYSYDAAGHLLSVTDNAQVSSPRQTRTYTYDLLGRITSDGNPESGSTYYTYDSVAGTNCTSSSPGDLVQQLDANGNTTCYYYDALHRRTSVTYAGPNSDGINKYFVYDSATVNGISMNYAENRLAETYTCSGSCTTKITDEGFSYNQRGELSDYYQSSPNSGGYYHLSAAYWEDGQLKAVSGIGLPTLSYGGLDGEARVTTVTASGGTNPVTGVTYNNSNSGGEPIGALTSVTLGTGDTQNFTWDPNTGRMKSYTSSVGTGPTVISGALTWNANGTLEQLNISDAYNNSDTQNCSYLYDDFVRAASVNCVNGSTNVWNQSFTYGSDAFGNLTKSVPQGGVGDSWPPPGGSYNSSSNQYTGISGVAYDANGDLTSDTFHSYTWLADGHLASISTGTSSTSIIYDAEGNKVEENGGTGGSLYEYVSEFGISAQMSGQTEVSADVELPGGMQALYANGSLVRFRYPDWQGSVRAESSVSSRVFTESVAFAPFGERYAQVGTPFNVDSFTGKPDQLASDEYDFAARELHDGQGRWISPDPMRGTGNKYAYANNNPLSNVDLCGLIAAVDLLGNQVPPPSPAGFDVLESDLSDLAMTEADESHPPVHDQTPGNGCFKCLGADGQGGGQEELADDYKVDMKSHGAPHVDRVDKNGELVGRYDDNGNPIPHGGKQPGRVPNSDKAKFDKALEELRKKTGKAKQPAQQPGQAPKPSGGSNKTGVTPVAPVVPLLLNPPPNVLRLPQLGVPDFPIETEPIPLDVPI